MLHTVSSFSNRKLSSSLPGSLASPNPCGPRVRSHSSSVLHLEPTLALKSPSSKYGSLGGILSRACCRLLKNLSSALSAANVGA